MNNERSLAALSWTLTGSHPHYWRLRQSMETGLPTEPQYGPYPAHVPGSVQRSLLEAGVIPDWTAGDNALACEWVENRHWSFAATLPDDWLAGHRAWTLRCDGLDHAGWVRLNGREVGSFRGAYTPHVFDLEPFLRDSGNTLQIVFDLPPRWQGQFGFTSKMTEPKPRFNFTWDWQPRLVQIGIWDAVRLVAKAKPKLDELKIATDFDGTGRLRVRADLRQADAVRLTLARDGACLFQETISTAALGQGIERTGLAVTPWLPIGVGEAAVYDLRFELLDAEGARVAEETRQVGFRSVAWRPCAGAPSSADPWICEVNGRPIFLQGVNWTPIRANFADVPDSEYEKRLKLYRELGANVLRLWGGGFPERDIFFDLCDRFGLFVWVEFPLSSSGYENLPPDEPEAVERFAAIATRYVQRLRHHPCVLLWGGGNELQQPGNRPCDGSEPLLRRFRDIASQLDPQRRFVPTSASGPREFGDRAEFGQGLHWDTHGPWRSEGPLETWWNPYWEQDDALLRSEVGAPGASSLDLIRRHAGNLKPFPCDERNPLWGQPVTWWNDWRHFVAELGHEPTDLEEYVAWSQQRQADALRHAAACCKNRFPRCGGFIVWMGHDSFPMAANTAIIDYDGNPKPAWHALRDVFNPEPRTPNPEPRTLNPEPRTPLKGNPLPTPFHPIKLFGCDLNWTMQDQPFRHCPPSAPHDWAFINPKAYFDWHNDFGNNVMFCQAYTFGGYAFYPSKLGPVAPGPGCELFPALYDLAVQAKMPTWSYFCVGADLIMSNLRDHWVVPTSRQFAPHGFLAPESPWTELLCDRIAEFLTAYPVDWLLFDWFVYGHLVTDKFQVQPAWFVKEPFAEIIGRPMPEKAEDITPEENLRYKREALTRQFRRLRETVKRASPKTRIIFNVPYWGAAEAIWVDHPMLRESDGLFAESSDDAVVEWLLSVRRPEQRVMTTVIGRLDGEHCDPNSWRKWVARGCDLMGYAWGTPPDFRPHPSYEAGLRIIREAFAALPGVPQ